jgi:hypothetical protein
MLELIQALHEGKILYKDNMEDDSNSDFREYLFYDPQLKYLGRKGWGSAIGEKEHTLYDVFMNPDKWHIHSHVGGYPYPWSIRYQDLENQN